MMIGVGIDTIEIARVEKAVARAAFCNRVYTEAERAYAQMRKNDAEAYAGMFAAKEAVSKALGTGFSGFAMQDIEVLHRENHAPYAVLHGNAKAIFDALGAKGVWISISHDRSSAVAVAVIEA